METTKGNWRCKSSAITPTSPRTSSRAMCVVSACSGVNHAGRTGVGFRTWNRTTFGSATGARRDKTKDRGNQEKGFEMPYDSYTLEVFDDECEFGEFSASVTARLEIEPFDFDYYPSQMTHELTEVLVYTQLGLFEYEPDEAMKQAVASAVESWIWNEGIEAISEAVQVGDKSVRAKLNVVLADEQAKAA